RKFNVDISETVVIGDSPADYQMGKNAGIDKVILVASGQISKEKLSNYSKYTVSSLGDIKILNCK
ncbi:MAG TPA: HAD hydrolase-like protein, partial [Spirochaetota bacterium]|nr:HAD hydrolase-like protein [Spirochaetota bacterium]